MSQIGKKEIGCSILADYKKLYPSASNSRKKKRNEEYKRLDCNKINYIANWKNELQVFEKTQIPSIRNPHPFDEYK